MATTTSKRKWDDSDSDFATTSSDSDNSTSYHYSTNSRLLPPATPTTALAEHQHIRRLICNHGVASWFEIRYAASILDALVRTFEASTRLFRALERALERQKSDVMEYLENHYLLPELMMALVRRYREEGVDYWIGCVMTDLEV